MHREGHWHKRVKRLFLAAALWMPGSTIIPQQCRAGNDGQEEQPGVVSAFRGGSAGDLGSLCTRTWSCLQEASGLADPSRGLGCPRDSSGEGTVMSWSDPGL